MLALDAVVFEGSRPVFDADGRLVAVSRARFSAITANGLEIEGSGELWLPAQNQGHNDPASSARLDNIIGRFSDITDGTSKTFTGRAQVEFDSISVDQQHFEATGDMRLRAELLEPALVREFEIEADAVRGNDGRWSARFHGADKMGLGVRVEGVYVSTNERGVWDDADIVHLQGDVEALGLLDPEANPISFEDKMGSEEVYFVYDGPGRLEAIVPSATDAGRFTATLTLRVTGHEDNGALNIQVGDVIVTQSQRAPDGKISGRVEAFFSGVGSRNGVAVTVSGTAEFRFQGDSADGIDWFMASGELRMLSATLEDAATGGTLLFEDISGSQGQARIVGRIDASGQVDLTGGLGQVSGWATFPEWY